MDDRRAEVDPPGVGRGAELGTGGAALERRRPVVGAGVRAGTGHYRSTPPMTGSMEPTAVMTSATMPPIEIADADCRLTKDGSRKCTRYGRVPPSLTTWAPSPPRGDSTREY